MQRILLMLVALLLITAMTLIACQNAKAVGEPEVVQLPTIVPAAPDPEVAPLTEEVAVAAVVQEEPARKGPVQEEPPAAQDDGEFAENAFPPTISDTKQHQKAWLRDDCLRCHETGVEDAPMIQHEGLPEILLTAKCRSCHVLIPGSKPKPKPVAAETDFAVNAFPPMMPASESHNRSWVKDDCMLCHEDGTQGAPIVKHENLPPLYLDVKCRSCHVQVRAVEATAETPPK